MVQAISREESPVRGATEWVPEKPRPVTAERIQAAGLTVEAFVVLMDAAVEILARVVGA